MFTVDPEAFAKPLQGRIAPDNTAMAAVTLAIKGLY